MKTFCILLLNFLFFFSAEATIIYVNHTATGANDGSSWTDAYVDLDDALDAAAPGDQLWVAWGTYKPVGGGSFSAARGSTRYFTFTVSDSVEVYGGFNGTETMLSQRDFKTYITVLSGDIGTQFDSTDNSYTVVTVPDSARGVRIDGFHIVEGNSDAVSGAFDSRELNGGGLYAYPKSVFTVANCVFKNNRAERGGGGMYTHKSSVDVLETTFRDNSAVQGGGAEIYTGFSSDTFRISISTSRFENNRLVSNANSGAGLYLNADCSSRLFIDIDSCAFVDNIGHHSKTDGGGLRLAVNGASYCITAVEFNLSNSVFTENVAQYGGGLYMGSQEWDELTATINDCIFQGNVAGWSGGGIRSSWHLTTISRNVITANTAGWSGGGIWTNDRCRIESSLIAENSASNGGGIWARDSLVLMNCTVTENVATERGGGLYFEDDIDAASPNDTGTVCNSIFSHNSAGLEGEEIYVEPYDHLRLQWSLLHTDSIPDGVLDEGGILLNQDPLFRNPAQDNYELLTLSPAINSGSSSHASSPTDLKGDVRVQYSSIDLGAYEYSCAASIPNPVYVDQSANGNNDGSSWADAFNYLQDAIALIEFCGINLAQEIWVAKGSYTPTRGTDINAVFELRDGMRLYGGFAGWETLRDQRDHKVNPTILSPNIGDPADSLDNTTRIILGDSLSANSIIDGFHFESSSNLSLRYPGAGPGSVVISNCIFSHDLASYETAVSMGIGAEAIFENCDFTGSKYTNAVKVHSSTAQFRKCKFENNEGLLIWGVDAEIILANSILAGNQSGGSLGGIFTSGLSNIELINCTVFGNKTAAGIAFFESGGMEFQATNCIFSGNGDKLLDLIAVDTAELSHCLLDSNDCSVLINGGTVTCTDMILAHDPAFVDTASLDLRLLPYSAALDMGLNGAMPANYDIAGEDRITCCFVDLGAHEFQCPSVGRLYVDSSATGYRDGHSWTNAYTDLQAALQRADTCSEFKEIWVAQGTYFPTAGANRNTSFQLPDSVKIFGGFIGNETTRNERNWHQNKTILSGDIGLNGTPTDNTFHIVIADRVSDSTVLDGFIIEFGYADGAGTSAEGAGLLNLGAGAGKSEPHIKNCVFRNHFATANGAAVMNKANGGGRADAVFENCMFQLNHADQRGGAVYNDGSGTGVANPTFINCAFANNSASLDGGAMYNHGFAGESDPRIINCTFAGNSGFDGAALFNNGMNAGSARPEIINSIFWSNPPGNLGATMLNLGGGAQPNLDFTLIEEGACPPGASCGANMTYALDPLLTDIPNIDLRPNTGSPALEAGFLPIVQSSRDLNNNPRVLCCDVDLGAIEDTSCTQIIYVNHTATGTNTGVNWANAFTDLQDALALVSSCAGYTEIWVAQGEYYPTTCIFCPPAQRAKSFELVDGIGLYGGFNGTENVREERNYAINKTTLSGNIGTAGTLDNSYQVVKAINVGPSTILDGFTITQGNANGAVDKSGAGLLIDASASGVLAAPQILNCIFTENVAQNTGGAVHVTTNDGTASPVFANNLFHHNDADEGGAISIIATGANGLCNPEFVNITFVENHAISRAGWMYSDGVAGGSSEPHMVNCIISGHTVTSGFDPNITESGTSLAHLEFTNIDEVSCPTYTCGTGMQYQVNPEFLNPGAFDYRVGVTSPVVDAGLNAAKPATVHEDLVFAGRIVDGNCSDTAYIDLGAYEVAAYSGSGVLYVDPAASGLGNGESWSDAMTDLSAALNFTKIYDCISEIWVKSGSYKPTTGIDRTTSFELPDGKPVYGGFAGTELVRSDRDWQTNVTILSGDIGTLNDSTDNSYNVLVISDVVDTATLDGFHVVEGNADHGSSAVWQQGGGVWQDPAMSGVGVLRNCTLSKSYGTRGGAIFCGSRMLLDNTFITQNNAGIAGSAIANNLVSSDLILRDVQCIENSTTSSILENANGAQVTVQGDCNISK